MITNWPASEKLACIERELKWRHRVYPRRVSEGKMTQHQMDREINIMEAIAADLRAVTESERLL
jgi:hypothetical protein